MRVSDASERAIIRLNVLENAQVTPFIMFSMTFSGNSARQSVSPLGVGVCVCVCVCVFMLYTHVCITECIETASQTVSISSSEIMWKFLVVSYFRKPSLQQKPIFFLGDYFGFSTHKCFIDSCLFYDVGSHNVCALLTVNNSSWTSYVLFYHETTLRFYTFAWTDISNSPHSFFFDFKNVFSRIR